MSEESPNRPNRWRRITIRVARLALLAYLAITVLLVTMETRLIYPGAYFGQSHGDRTKALDISTFEVIGKDGFSLPGRLLHRPEARNHVLFLHGNGVRAAQLDHWTRRLSQAFDATVLTAEYRGFEDDRKPNETGIIADALAAHHSLQEKYDLNADEIIIYGRSLGGGCAAAVAAEHQPKTLVLDRTFDALWKVAASKFPLVPVSLLMRNRFESADRLAKFEGKLIQIHGTPDEVVPVDRGKALFDAVGTNRKSWLEVPGMLHNDRMSDELLNRIAGKVLQP